MRKLSYLFLMFILFSLTGCKMTEDEPAPFTTPKPVAFKKGVVNGTVYAKNGVKTIGGAIIFTFDDNHKIHMTTSGADGKFHLEAPAGNRIIHIQTGDGSNFRTEIPLVVVNNETHTLPASVSKLNQIANMAYVKGSYDEIEDIVIGLGYTISQISYDDLKNMSTIAAYDVIFLNCGSRTQGNSGTATPNNDTMIYDNLATFVTNGGSLYASDWDVAYLLGGNSNTNACNTAGGFIPDALLCSTNTGPSTTFTNCTVASAGLAGALGFTSLDIQYDLGSWQRIINYDATFWDVLVSHSSEPLMIRTNKFQQPTAPQMAVGNSANSGFVTICHNDNGTSATITISQSDLQAHLGHGDTVGACATSTNSGNIYYTTFHNHASGNIGNTGPILQYVILNL